MAAVPQTTAPQMIDFDTAYTHVHNSVYAPLFFEKLAGDYGISPANEQEAMQMLTMAAQLRQAHELEQEKQASAAGSVLDAASQHLNAVLGHQVPAAPTHNDNLVKRAAAQLARDPRMAAAVLAIQANAVGVTPESLAAGT